MPKKKVGGLAGVVVGDSAICTCGLEEQTLSYYGYQIEDMAEHACFEEVAYLLLRGRLPNAKELEIYQTQLAAKRDLPTALKTVLEQIPSNANMMDVLRTAVSFLGNIEQESESYGALEIADRLIASLPSMLMYWYQFHQTGKRIDLDTGETSTAAHFLRLLYGTKPSELQRRSIDVSLILYAEHEFNASTFTVRTITSTLPDFYSAICGGIGALRGPLHGGANEKALDLILRFNDPESADKGIMDILEKKELIMGFGHRVYTSSDPRSPIIHSWAKKLADSVNNPNIMAVAERIDSVMAREKNLFPNLDFYSAVAYHCADIPQDMFTPIFVFSRITGWSAHLMEQRAKNKLIRPNSNYTGPGVLPWLPMQQR
ncbi:MAG: 2-methylcitrate synthase [Waddliaceae bacterium]|nr:2-methylcitrate synthase [Waddliaceae bacterium]